nr:hypothetical protein B0A51_13038 [Rachicladosporium sp. CCFEE 5018]
MAMLPTHLHADGVQATVDEPKANIIVEPLVEVVRPALQPVRNEEEGMSWIGTLGLVGFTIFMLLHAAITLYEEWDHRQPHTHPLLLNVSRYDTIQACTSPAEPSNTNMIFADWKCLRWKTSAAAVSFVYSPHHDIQWLEDFGHCTLWFFPSGDCSGNATHEIGDVANEDKMGKCWIADHAKPKSAYLKCEKEWEATYCEKVNGLKIRQKEECGDGSLCRQLMNFWDRANFYVFGGQGWRVFKRALLG